MKIEFDIYDLPEETIDNIFQHVHKKLEIRDYSGPRNPDNSLSYALSKNKR